MCWHWIVPLTVTPPRPNDASDSNWQVFEIGSEGSPPGNPDAGSGAPIGGWWNATRGKITVDWHFGDLEWDETGYCGLFILGEDVWWWGTALYRMTVSKGRP